MSEMDSDNVDWGDGVQEGQSLPRAVKETVEQLGYECVHAGMRGGPGGVSLQVLIDSLGGINVDDCEIVSKSLNRMLDGANFPELEGRYYLEVSSPGVERPLFTLEQYGRFLGREARLRLNEPFEGRKSLTGTISAAEGEGVTLYVAEEERDIFVPFNLIKGGNLVFRTESQRPRKGGKRLSAKKKCCEEEL
ncbi:MAG: ribosome maturation factor RimP [Fretibacterium sp.]|nr:ribosome maturation factor RimP [Fretibacterium sp.]